MNQKMIIVAMAGFAIGSSVTSYIKNRQQSAEINTSKEAVRVIGDTAQQYMESFQKLNDQNAELFTLAKSYEDAKKSADKTKIAETLVYKIKEFNFPTNK